MKLRTVDFSAQLRDRDYIAAQWVRLSSEHKTSSPGRLYIRGARKLRGGQPYGHPDELVILIHTGREEVGVEVSGRTAWGVYSAPWAKLPTSAEHVYENLTHDAVSHAPQIARRNYHLIIETWNAFIDILTGAPPLMEQMHEEYDYNR
jgi:hypothetical protein